MSILPTIKTFQVYSTIRWFNLFCNQELSITEYIQFISKSSTKTRYELKIHERLDYIKTILKFVDKVYNAIIEGNTDFFTHNTYLKFFIDNIDDFNYSNIETLLIDEAQDLNPIMLKLVKAFIKNKKNLIAVGDSNQSIYNFLNNINLLKELKKDKIKIINKSLTKSFRFSEGTDMEEYSNLILNQRKQHISGASEEPIPEIRETMHLGRSNAQVLWYAYQAAIEEKDFCLLGSLNDNAQEFFRDIWYIMNGEVKKVKNKILKNFSNIKDLKTFAMDENDQEILSALVLLEKWKKEPNGLEGFIKSVRKHDKDERLLRSKKDQQVLFFSSIHKAKGMEYEEVEILPKLSDTIALTGFKYNIIIKNKTILDEAKSKSDEATVLKMMPNNQIKEELNLLYVAFTRARFSLNILNTEVNTNIRFLELIAGKKIKQNKTVYISDSMLETMNSKYEYLSNDFIPIVISEDTFLINVEEWNEFLKVLKEF